MSFETALKQPHLSHTQILQVSAGHTELSAQHYIQHYIQCMQHYIQSSKKTTLTCTWKTNTILFFMIQPSENINDQNDLSDFSPPSPLPGEFSHASSRKCVLLVWSLSEWHCSLALKMDTSSLPSLPKRQLLRTFTAITGSSHGFMSKRALRRALNPECLVKSVCESRHPYQLVFAF